MNQVALKPSDKFCKAGTHVKKTLLSTEIPLKFSPDRDVGNTGAASISPGQLVCS